MPCATPTHEAVDGSHPNEGDRDLGVQAATLSEAARTARGSCGSCLDARRTVWRLRHHRALECQPLDLLRGMASLAAVIAEPERWRQRGRLSTSAAAGNSTQAGLTQPPRSGDGPPHDGCTPRRQSLAPASASALLPSRVCRGSGPTHRALQHLPARDRAQRARQQGSGIGPRSRLDADARRASPPSFRNGRMVGGRDCPSPRDRMGRQTAEGRPRSARRSSLRCSRPSWRGTARRKEQVGRGRRCSRRRGSSVPTTTRPAPPCHEGAPSRRHSRAATSSYGPAGTDWPARASA
jgi:hypothetical protein